MASGGPSGLIGVSPFAPGREGSLVRSGTRSERWGWRPENVFSRTSESWRRGEEESEDDALQWAALEKLPSYDRMRNAIFTTAEGTKVRPAEKELRRISPEDRKRLIQSVFGDGSTQEENEIFLRKLRERIARVDLSLPNVEVRYENLNIQAKAVVASRALPTLLNAARNTVESFLDKLGLPVTKKIDKEILLGVSGIIKPRRVTLLLGPPGAGKTTLLLALAGALEKGLKFTGEITYNGYRLNEFVPKKTAAYISQHDLHLGEMTVRETLEFSSRCQGVGGRYDLLAEIIQREKEMGIVPEDDVDIFMKATALQEASSPFVTEYIMKMLGLDICADTLVGDDMHRGVSGGQKKRVTTAEMIVGPMTVLLMDEISTGLDSSTTFQIVKCLQDVAHVLDFTILIALLQPAPETYNLFDDILLLAEGQVVYHGPREDILAFFEGCGYTCPQRKGVADFLQEVTSRKDQEQYWSDKSRPHEYTPVKEFADAFKNYHLGTAMAAEFAVPFDKTKSHPAALVFDKKTVPTMEQFRAVFEKEALLMKRNSFVYVFKSVQIFVVSLVAMTVFFRTEMPRNDLEDAQVFGGALFFGVLNVMFNGFAELAMIIVRLPVFFKQRDLLLFPPWTFSLSKLIQSVPISLLESTIWIVTTYYTIGFAPAAGRFFRQLLLYFWVNQAASGLFRVVAGVCQTMIIANTGGSMALLLIFVLGGFLLPRTSVKHWWIWAYWMSPLSYAQNAVNVNEFLAPQWNHHIPYSTRTLGRQFLKNAGLFARGYWFWLAIGALIGYTVVFNLMFTFAITFLSAPSGRRAVAIDEFVDDDDQPGVPKTSDGPGSKKSSIPRSILSGLRRNSSSVLEVSEGPTQLGNEGSHLQMTAATSSSSVRRRSSSSVRDSGGHVATGMILPFRPLSISFEDVSYYVDLPSQMKKQVGTDSRLQLLQEVTGSFRPGVLTALVGVSGAGKSTLMDVLAGRKTGGYIEGDIRISGFPKKQETFSRISGYCEQNDIHSPQLTVKESLTYSAWLRLSSDTNGNTRELFVDQVLDLVELTPLKDALVGLPGVSGLSTEQRKRLTISVELVANPSIIFMDEPTSGLDARAAAIVMRCVRNTVDTGRTVVCTIHQPSIDIFEAFDELLLLKRGGQTIYAGPLGRESCELVKYFEAIEGVPCIEEGINPATWMLDVSSPSMEQHLGVDFAQLFKESTLFEETRGVVKQLSVPGEGAEDLWFPSQFAQPFGSQLQACLWKQNLTYWRSPDYNNVRFVFTIIAAFLFGTIFWRMGKKNGEQKYIFSIMGAMFGAVMFIGVNNASTVQPVVATERTVFYRERGAGMYSAVPYALAQIIIEIPYCFAQTIIYGVLTYAMMALQWTAAKFFWYLFFMFFTFIYFTYYGMMAVGLTPNQQIAAVVSGFFYAIFNLFSGFLITKPRIPDWWIWYYWICPVAWTIYGIIASQFGDVSKPLLQADGSTVTVRHFVQETYGFKHGFLGVVAPIVVLYPVLFACVFIFSIKFLNFQSR